MEQRRLPAAYIHRRGVTRTNGNEMYFGHDVAEEKNGDAMLSDCHVMYRMKDTRIPKAKVTRNR